MRKSIKPENNKMPKSTLTTQLIHVPKKKKKPNYKSNDIGKNSNGTM